MSFELSVAENEYLPADAAEVNAIVTVAAPATLGVGTTAKLCEVIVVDISTSMQGARLRSAREAAAVAVDQILDGAHFAIIAGNHRATVIVPMAESTPERRTFAKQIVGNLQCEGGTAIGTWLEKASEQFALTPGDIHHCLLLTDGKDESEAHNQLEQAIASCIGQFQCDCRGVGTNWIVEELRSISSALLGTVDIVPEPSLLSAEFARIIQTAMSKQVGDVGLRVWTPQGSHLQYLKEVFPAEEDRTSMATPVNPLTVDFPTGAWAAGESRDYHLCVHVTPAPVNEERLAARVSIVVNGEPTEVSLVRARWTDDEALSARICPEVAHYTGQSDLAQAIADGLEALQVGDQQTATVKLGNAVKLASDVNNTQTLKLLQRVVDVDDAPTGTIRLKSSIDKADEMALDTRRTVTVRIAVKD